MPDRTPVPPRFGLFPLPLHRQGAVFWCQTQMASGPVAVALAASVPQDVANTPRPNNRKDQLDLTLELQLWCLDWSPPLLLLPSSTPGQPRPAPPHSTHPEIVLGLDLWDLLKENLQKRDFCVCVCHPVREWFGQGAQRKAC